MTYPFGPLAAFTRIPPGEQIPSDRLAQDEPEPIEPAEPSDNDSAEAARELGRLLGGGTVDRSRGIAAASLEDSITRLEEDLRRIGEKLTEIRTLFGREERRSDELEAELTDLEGAFERLTTQIEGLREAEAESAGRSDALGVVLQRLAGQAEVLSRIVEDLETRLERFPLGEGDFSLRREGYYFSAGYCFGQLSGTNPLDFESVFPLAGTICQNYELGIRFGSVFRGIPLAIASEWGLIYQTGRSSEEIDQEILPFGEDNDFLQELLEFSVERNSHYHLAGSFYRWFASPAFRNGHFTLIQPSFELGLLLGVIETVDQADEEAEPETEWIFAPTGAVGGRLFEIDEGPVQLFLNGRIRVLVAGVNGTLFEGSLGIAINPGEL